MVLRYSSSNRLRHTFMLQGRAPESQLDDRVNQNDQNEGVRGRRGVAGLPLCPHYCLTISALRMAFPSTPPQFHT